MTLSASAEAAAAEDALDLGPLPLWNLSDLYPAIDAPELTRDLERGRRDAETLAATYRGRLGSLDARGLAAAIKAYEALDELLSKIMSYAQLVQAGDMESPVIGQFYQSTSEAVTEISAIALFFTLELNALDDKELAPNLAEPALAHYRSWVEESRALKPHQLSEEIETLLHEKHVAGRAAWNRLFDETMAGLRVPFRGQQLTTTEILNKVVDSDGLVRKEAAQAFGATLSANRRVFARITNTLAKDKEIEDRWRGYAKPISARNKANRVEDEVVQALIDSVRGAYPRLSHRYYALKAKWFGQEHLDWWDRNAPLPAAPDRLIRWPEARDIVLDAYAAFSPELARVGKSFFDKPWIDAPARPAKASGAFAHPTVPSAHPYLLVNYLGRVRDVMTLAHELGHGVHQVLASDQGHLLSDTPLTLAETASVFGEMLTFQALLKAETDPQARKVMLASKVEDMLNTVVRQIALHSFEEAVHDRRRQGELSPDELSEIWMGVQKASLGPALRFDQGYADWWAYIPHFIHSPFYVYAYAFGDCLVNSLYAVYQGAEAGFAEKYLAMLRAGGTKRHGALLAPFGLDARDKAFWTKGMDVIAGMIDELEQMK
jgi:oligoendopeptidase F